jgi:adenine deaminase
LDINFISDYEPEKDATVELKNGNIVDVINAKYFDENVSLIVRGGRIEAIPGVEGPAFSFHLGSEALRLLQR